MENKIFIVDDEGKEVEMNILFTFNNEDNDYVVVFENSKPDMLYAFRYDEEGNLYAVEEEDELEMVEEVVSAFEGQGEE